MVFRSPAKVNLGLRIVGRRSDGYHLLESLFWPIDLCDEIAIEKSGKNQIEMEWAVDAPVRSPLPDPEANSVYKLLSANPHLGTWFMHIKKRIPVGGGLGGSSSNVGTVLKFLRETQVISVETAKELALKAGADVPFFLDPYPTWVRGIGEERERLDSIDKHLKFHLVLIPKPCITKDIFGRYRNSGVPFSTPVSTPNEWNGEFLKTFLLKTANDLEEAAGYEVPEIANALSFLRGFGLPYAGLSGSGSTCFAVSKLDATGETFSKDLQQFCRKSNCSYIEANTFGA